MPAAGATDLPSVDADQTLREAQLVMTRIFKQAGIESAPVDARYLLQGILHLDAAALLGHGDRRVGEQAFELNAAISRRLKREPVSRILGYCEFYGRRFLVTPDVLVPRPDTECLVDLVLSTIKADVRLQRPLTIVDVGVGSGAIIATLLCELPSALGIGTDVSAAALAVARANAGSLGVHERLTLVQSSGIEKIVSPFDMLVANPPYIPTSKISELELDVRLWDPQISLNGGCDGLDGYREIYRQVSALRRPTPVFLEVGAGQSEEVERVFSGSSTVMHRSMDLGAHIRAVALVVHHQAHN